MSLTVVYNDDQWSVRDLINNLISTEEYQLKLQQKRRKKSSGKHGQMEHTANLLNSHNLFLDHIMC